MMKSERPPVLRWIALLMLVVTGAGCFEWQPAPVSPGQYFQSGGADRIVVLRTNGARLDLTDPIIRNDSIIALQTEFLPVRRSIIIGIVDIVSVEHRAMNTKNTAGMVGAIGVAMTVIAIVGKQILCDGCE